MNAAELVRVEFDAAQPWRPPDGARPDARAREPERADLDPIAAIDWMRLGDASPPEREFVVPGWLGRGHVTLLAANGGTGKTQLALQLAVSAALGRPWLGIETRAAPTLMLAAEDDDDELHRRVCRIAAFMGIRKVDLAGRLFLQGRVGLNNGLLLHPQGKQAHSLPLLGHIEERARSIGAGTVVLDNAAQFFGGDENDRSDVTVFVNALAGLARRLGAAVLLLGHPPKNGADYSGSTAWHAGVRSLWTMKPNVPGGGGGPSDGLVLTRAKANYATSGEAIRLRWIDGVLRLSEEPATGVEAAFRKHECEATFLKALGELNAQRRATSHSRRAGNYAPKAIVEAGLNGEFKVADLERAMNGLLRETRIRADARLWRRPNRCWVSGLAEVGWTPPKEPGDA